MEEAAPLKDKDVTRLACENHMGANALQMVSDVLFDVVMPCIVGGAWPV